MHIDITSAPPPDIFRERGKYLRFAIASLLLAGCGVLLAVYAVFSNVPYSKSLENVALGLFAGPGLVFVYFTEKLMAYRGLTQEQDRELTDLGQKSPEVAAYCNMIVKEGRPSIMAEFEACQAWVEKLSRKR